MTFTFFYAVKVDGTPTPVYAAPDNTDINRYQYPPQIIPIHNPCTGRLDLLIDLEAFDQGADGVATFDCCEQDCRHRIGMTKYRV
ncbi:MAG: hydrogenase iron-sulfur subunit [Candidatus Hodarchaeota archaeon]